MHEMAIQLAAEPDGSVIVSGGADGEKWTHVAPAEEVAAVRNAVVRLLDGFESAARPLADPVALNELGALL